MLHKNLLLPACFALTICTHAQVPLSGPDRYEVTFIKDRQRLPDEQRQARLRAEPGWQSFLQQHPGWRVEFNERNAKPRLAFGPGIPTTIGAPEERALSFLNMIAASFRVPLDELMLQPVVTTGKHHMVRFHQRHADMNVLWSLALVKMDLQGRVISFGLDVYDFPAALPEVVASEEQMRTSATAGVQGQLIVTIEPEAAILPVPDNGGVTMHVVRELRVRAEGAGIPSDLYCLVDATTGELLYRTDRVRSEHGHDGSDAGADVTFNATVSNTIPEPTSVLPMRNLEFVAGGQNFTTNANGESFTGLTGPITYTAPLSGSWGTVINNGSTPTLSGTLQEGSNEVSFDPSAIIEETSAYYHVNNIHDHAVDVLTGFTGMDFQLTINVELTTGDCNANYNGGAQSINFFTEANDCYSLALINDVVYHEYGHGINDNYYDDNGENFNNGAMNEGYADVWAFSLSLNPILAEGYKISTPAAYIRRYDADPKVYPADLIGEVHADGEIIAGAWWDLYENLGNMEQTMDLFAAAFAGLQAIAANGDEGDAFRNVLISTLEADDDDANLFNGTPNGTAISEAFAEHGITLISGFDVIHTPVETAPAGNGILIEATATVASGFDQYVQGVQLSYRANLGTWQQVMMTNTGGDNYETTIPGQPIGTVISYYIGLLDVGGALSGITPIAAAQADPNLPHYILVGYDLQLTENADNVNELGNWHLGMPEDNNTTGTWELIDPNPSYSTVDGSIIQTGDQHTPGGEFCFFTGNHLDSENEAPGTNDVDGGSTTLQSDPLDLSAYENPTITLYRWYTNSPPGGANPGQDWWYVQISNDGDNWTFVENTRTDDRSWRRLAFRVQDYMSQTSPITLRFIASDSTHVGQNLDGGSLIEGAVDDVQVWDNTAVGVAEINTPELLSVYPDPANDVINIVLDRSGAEDLVAEVLDPAGRVVLTQAFNGSGTSLRIAMDVGTLSAGGYVMRARWAGGSTQKRFSIVR